MEEATLTHPVPTDIEWPPTEDELPYSDGMPMECLWNPINMSYSLICCGFLYFSTGKTDRMCL